MAVTRQDIVREALSWKGTRFGEAKRLKGIACDCFTYPAEVMIACGLCTREKLPPYRQDWSLHTTEEHYIRLLLRFSREIFNALGMPSEGKEPGNVAAVRACGGRVFNHSAIIISWPRAIHCTKAFGVHEFSVVSHPMWIGNEVKFFDPLAERE